MIKKIFEVFIFLHDSSLAVAVIPSYSPGQCSPSSDPGMGQHLCGCPHDIPGVPTATTVNYFPVELQGPCVSQGSRDTQQDILHMVKELGPQEYGGQEVQRHQGRLHVKLRAHIY